MLRKIETHNSLRARYLKSRKRGNSLIEYMLVAILFALTSVLLLNMTSDNAGTMKAKAVADKMHVVQEAARSYVKANYAALMSKAPNPGSGALVIPVGRDSVNGAIPDGPSGLKSIQGAGLLPENFIDRNPFNQQSAVLIRKCGCVNDTLDVLVTTYGGREVPDVLLGLAANAMGAEGGFTPKDYVQTTDTGMVLGSYGGWKTKISEWGPVETRPASGTVQATLAFEDGSLLSDHLNRFDIGIPDANTMHTDINVNGNKLTKVNTISAEDPSDLTSSKGEVGLTGSLRATVDIYAEDGHFSGDVAAQKNVTAGQDLGVGRNAVIAGNTTIGKQTSTNSLHVGSTGAVAAGDAVMDNNLTVKKQAAVNDLVAEYINADAIIYAGSKTTFNKTKADGIRFGDLIGKLSPQYSYRVTAANNKVLKPVCDASDPTDFSRARIMIQRQTESYKVIPYVPLTTTSANGYLTQVWQTKDTSWVQIANAVVATDMTSYWNVNWLGDAASAGATRQAIALTYCYFG